MTWGHDDWSWWIRNEPDGYPGAAAPFEMLYRILGNVPGRSSKTIGDFGVSEPSRLQFLAAHFGRVIAIDDAHASLRRIAGVCAELDVEPCRRSPSALLRYARCLDIALAVDFPVDIAVRAVDDALDQMRDCLVEGGLLLATVRAYRRGSVASPMSLQAGDGWPGGMHELELQYRLRRIGLRGVRICRLGKGETPEALEDESLLCMAVRRANN